MFFGKLSMDHQKQGIFVKKQVKRIFLQKNSYWTIRLIFALMALWIDKIVHLHALFGVHHHLEELLARIFFRTKLTTLLLSTTYTTGRYAMTFSFYETNEMNLDSMWFQKNENCPSACTVWCAPSSVGIIGSYLFQEKADNAVTVNGVHYWKILNDFFFQWN